MVDSQCKVNHTPALHPTLLHDLTDMRVGPEYRKERKWLETLRIHRTCTTYFIHVTTDY